MCAQLVSPTGVESHLIRLLYIIGVEGGHTITMYTSRRGRTWCTVKTWGESTYSSSAELDHSTEEAGVLGALATACMMHVAKILQNVDRTDTWLSKEQVMDVWGDVQQRMDDFIHKHDPMGTVAIPPNDATTDSARGGTKKTKS